MKEFFGLTKAFLRRGVCSVIFAASVCICAVLMIFFVYRDYCQIGGKTGLYYFLMGIDVSGATDLLLMIAAFPAVMLFYEDYASGYFKMIYPRCGAKKYVFSVTLSSGIIAACAYICAYLIFTIFILTKFPLVPDENPEIWREETFVMANSGLLVNGNAVLGYLLEFFRKGAMAAFAAMLGIFQSMLLTNKYLTAISPVFTRVILFDFLEKAVPFFLSPSMIYSGGVPFNLAFGNDINGELISPMVAVYPFLFTFAIAIIVSFAEIFVLKFKLNRQI